MKDSDGKKQDCAKDVDVGQSITGCAEGKIVSRLRGAFLIDDSQVEPEEQGAETDK